MRDVFGNQISQRPGAIVHELLPNLACVSRGELCITKYLRFVKAMDAPVDRLIVAELKTAI